MSITALAMRRNGYTWGEITERLGFVSADAARECAEAAARMTDGGPVEPIDPTGQEEP